MIDAVANSRAQIATLCSRFHVSRLDIFGSGARAIDFSNASDIDLLVEYDEGYHPPALGEVFALRDALAELLGRKVDLTMAGAIRNPYVRAEIERYRQPLYGE